MMKADGVGHAAAHDGGVVLRLTAGVIYSLWSQDDKSLLIMPSGVPIDSRATAISFFSSKRST